MKQMSLSAKNAPFDLVCFSHLRWDFVFQRPQHLLTRAAKERRVFFIEEPIATKGSLRLELTQQDDGLYRAVPRIPDGLKSGVAINAVLRELIDRLLIEQGIGDFVAWYYTPMALQFTSHLRPLATVYDCMDELAAFKNAPRSLGDLERELFARADLIFTGGQSLFEAKRHRHHSVYAFPSSVDLAHFARAREMNFEPEDQKNIPHPRLGFFGVIDERFDIELLDALARSRPDWHFVMIGPFAKINPDKLPRHRNIHYLGKKSYDELPAYLAGWDVALLLFARNEATRFISPTKTPEYLAAGKPVVSTSIRDVVRPYGERNLVQIANTVDGFTAACERALNQSEAERAAHLARVDQFLAQTSWDQTWAQMEQLIQRAVDARRSLVVAAATNAIARTDPLSRAASARVAAS